jgi:hypothetical protein
MQEQIHGSPILAHHDIPKEEGTRKGRIILVDRGGGHGRFVTAWQGVDGANGPDEEWSWGHYFGSALEAHADFHARAKRGY